MTPEAWQFLLELAILFVGLYLAFVKSYFIEKGKSLATLQDISEITRLVESVKVEFARDTENLKSHLQFLTNVQNNLATEERNAVIEFNTKLFAWLNLLTDLTFGGIDNKNNLEIEKYTSTYQTAFSELRNSETKFVLFIEDTELIKEAHTIILSVIKEVATLPRLHLQELAFKNRIIDDLYALPENTIDKYSRIQTLIAERSKFHKDYFETITQAYSKVVKDCSVFQRSCRSYLYKLFSNNSLNILNTKQ